MRCRINHNLLPSFIKKFPFKKKFGQNFLCDTALISNIIRAINPQPAEKIIEIGPGLGALTLPLSQSGAQLTVIDIDPAVITFMQKQDYGKNLTLHHGDALKFNFAGIMPPVKIVGNLPYNIATPLLLKLTELAAAGNIFYFMVQKEVAARLAALTGESKFGRLSVFMQYFFNINILFTVPNTAFYPTPKVESAFIKMTPHPKLHGRADNLDNFRALIKNAFRMKRKTLYNNLKNIFTVTELTELGINPGLRPEKLSIENYVTLSNYLSARTDIPCL